MIALTATTLFTPLERIEQPLVLLEGESIVEVTTRAHREVPRGCRVADFGDGILVPGLIDIHIHGGAGHDVMAQEPDALSSVERLLARHGVSSYFPTTVTAPLDVTFSALQRLAHAIEQAQHAQTNGELRARPLGIHLEGPFLSHGKRGVHPPENLLAPDPVIFEKFWQASRGQIRLLTIAPELPGALDVITQAVNLGVCVSVGHSDASLDSTRAAVDAGARHATHTFNAMRPLGHRDPGILAEVLTDPRVSADIIADGIHVDPTVVQLFLKAKGPDAAVLITDANAATGMPDGRYHLGPFEFEVHEGRCLCNGTLAGSVLTMDRAIRNVVKFAGWDLQQAVRLATLNPARVARVPTRGALKPGLAADLVVLSPEGEVRNTIIRGSGI